MKVNEVDVLDYISTLKKEFPTLRVYYDKPWWLSFIYSLPGIKKLKWEEATQCIGMNIYLSTIWHKYSAWSQLSTLRHERQHLLDFKKYTTILASFLYLFCFFPIGLAYFRAVFERAGFKESLRTRVEVFGASDNIKEKGLEMYLNVFTGWTYLKMWPFPKTIKRWFEEDWQDVLK